MNAKEPPRRALPWHSPRAPRVNIVADGVDENEGYCHAVRTDRLRLFRVIRANNLARACWYWHALFNLQTAGGCAAGRKEVSTDENRRTAAPDKANRLPLLPGVYIMKDVRGEVIYVGQGQGAQKPRDKLFPRRAPAKGRGNGGQGGTTST